MNKQTSTVWCNGKQVEGNPPSRFNCVGNNMGMSFKAWKAWKAEIIKAKDAKNAKKN